MSKYEATGPLPYRGHKPGELFEAVLDEETERRAVELGAIRVVETSQPGLVPNSWRLPAGWTHKE